MIYTHLYVDISYNVQDNHATIYRPKETKQIQITGRFQARMLEPHLEGVIKQSQEEGGETKLSGKGDVREQWGQYQVRRTKEDMERGKGE